MITVGINDNLQIASVVKAEQGTLNIIFKPAQGAAAAAPTAVGIFDELNDTSEGSVGNEMRYIHWPYKMDEYVKTGEELLEAIKQSKEFLNHILKQYMTEDKIQWNVMQGINLDNDPVTAMGQITQAAVIEKIYDNQITQFIAMMTPFVGAGSPSIRVKCSRQSKNKHYPSLPRFAPFIESMGVPAAQSKLKFTAWEKTNGYDSGEEMSEEAATPDTVAPSETAAANSLFV